MEQRYNKSSEYTISLASVSLFSILKLNINQFKLMSEFDIPVHYYRYIPMFEEYLEMLGKGEKKAYIILFLADKYDVFDSTVKRVIKALSLRVTL